MEGIGIILKTWALWLAVLCGVVGVMLLVKGLYGWCKLVYWFVTDRDDLCEYPEISDDME